MQVSHNLLKRQIDRHLANVDPALLEQLQDFIMAIDLAYKEADEDRAILERSLEISSQELLQINSEMRAVFEAFPDLFFRIDSEGKITDYIIGNKSDLLMPPHKFLGRRIQDIPLGEIAKTFQTAIDNVRKNRSMEILEYSLEIRGETKWFEARMVPLMEDQIVVIIRNITERKQSESELEQYRLHLERLVEERTTEIRAYQEHLEELVRARTAELELANERLKQEINERKRIEKELIRKNSELEEKTLDLELANEEIRKFAYMISHDLRSPLVNIKGFSGELQIAFDKLRKCADMHLDKFEDPQRSEIMGVIYEDIPEALQFINSSASRMDNMINAILKLSRIGLRGLVPQCIDMNQLVEEILNTMKHQLEAKRTTLKITKLPCVIADKFSMEQILGNLLDNAVKYLDPSRPGLIEITGEEKGHLRIFHIRDNGRGISENDCEKIFELFCRVGKQDVPGEGMGLAYAKTLVRRHGGRIWCQSKIGEGSTFSFSISNRVVTGGINESKSIINDIAGRG